MQFNASLSNLGNATYSAKLVLGAASWSRASAIQNLYAAVELFDTVALNSHFYRAALDAEAVAQGIAGNSEDAKIGAIAFATKQKPEFCGH